MFQVALLTILIFKPSSVYKTYSILYGKKLQNETNFIKRLISAFVNNKNSQEVIISNQKLVCS